MVGPVCESADSFATGRNLPATAARLPRRDPRCRRLRRGDGTTYNARPRAAAVLIPDGKFHLITPRETIEDLWADEMLPPLAG